MFRTSAVNATGFSHVFTVNHVTLGDSHRLLKESMVIAHNRRIVTVVFLRRVQILLLTYLLTYLPD